MSEGDAREGDARELDLAALLEKVVQAEAVLSQVRAELEEFTPSVAAGSPSTVEEAETPAPTLSVQEKPFKAVSEGYRLPIEQLFHLASSQPLGGEELEAALSDILHVSAKVTPRSVKMMVRFPWKRFMKSWSQYLKIESEPNSFEVVRTNPKEIGGALRAKVYLSVAGKQPSPIELARDEEQGSPWGIVSFSL